VNEKVSKSEASDRQAMFEVLRRLRDELRRIVPSGNVQGTPFDGVILSMFWRTVRHYDAIVILLERDLPEEAAELSRSLFEESLKLRQVGEDQDRRLALVAQHLQNGITQLRYLFDTADDPAAQAKVTEQERQLAELARRNGVGKYAEFLSPKAAAKRYQRVEDLDFHALTQQFVHGNEIATTFSRDQSTPGVLTVRDRTTTLWVQLGVALFASLSLVEATRGTAQVFGWQGVDALAAIQDELDAIQKRVERP
jgi:hypothetical protein